MKQILILTLVVVFLAGCSSQNVTEDSASTAGITPGQIDTATGQESSDSTASNSGESIDYSKMEPSLSEEVLAQKYFDATEKDVKTSLIGKHKFALFFHAGWCPTCLNMEKEIKAGLKDLAAETKIAKVNYDSETGLKQELGITAQSTVVVFEKSGKIHEVLVSPNLEQIKTSLSEAK